MQSIRTVEDFERWLEVGDRHHVNGDIGIAIHCYTKAITLCPNEAIAYLKRGLAFAKQKNLKAAIFDYTQVLTLNPNDAMIYNNAQKNSFQIKKYDLLCAIKKLADIDQIQLLEKCLNQDNPLGVYFWKQEGIKECNLESGTLIEIRKYLAELYVKKGRINIGKITNTPSTMFNPGQTQPDRDRPDSETIHKYCDRKFL